MRISQVKLVQPQDMYLMITSLETLIVVCHDLSGNGAILGVAKPPWALDLPWDIVLKRQPNERTIDFKLRVLSEIENHKYTHVFETPSICLSMYDFDPYG